MEIRSFGTSGSGPGQFNYPHGIAVDGEGNVLVADNDNHRIQQFTAEGQLITSVRKLTGRYQFYLPKGIIGKRIENFVLKPTSFLVYLNEFPVHSTPIHCSS